LTVPKPGGQTHQHEACAGRTGHAGTIALREGCDAGAHGGHEVVAEASRYAGVCDHSSQVVVVLTVALLDGAIRARVDGGN
jgi:hypothetical protein